MDIFMWARAKLSVMINDVFIPLNNAPDALKRYVTPAFFHHEGEAAFDLTAPGTAFLFRYRNRNFGICTGHQLGTGNNVVKPEQFTLLADDNLGISPNQVGRVKMGDPKHKNLEDIFIAEYAHQRGEHDMRPLFIDLDLEINLQNVRPELVQAVFTIGFPTCARDGDFELDDEGVPVKWMVKARWVKIYLRVDEAKQLDTENRIAMVLDERANQEPIDPDGMSGSPVFFIGKTDDHNAFLGFVGMITDAGNGRYMIYDAAIIRQVLDAYIDK